MVFGCKLAETIIFIGVLKHFRDHFWVGWFCETKKYIIQFYSQPFAPIFKVLIFWQFRHLLNQFRQFYNQFLVGWFVQPSSRFLFLSKPFASMFLIFSTIFGCVKPRTTKMVFNTFGLENHFWFLTLLVQKTIS